MIKISGFTYVRNGFKYGYPFIASIQSLLPLVDELIVVVGNSTDDTREAIVNLGDSKIKIIDTVWDEALRENGQIFAQQSNIGLAATQGRWAFHLQVDEVLHEADYAEILNTIAAAELNTNVEGILFPFLHFWGDFRHIRNTRKTHPYEIRVFKKTPQIKSYKDSQGFRKYPSEAAYKTGHPGEKLKVWKTKARIFHYSYSRHPSLMKQKATYFNRFWHNDEWVAKHTEPADFDFNAVDYLETFDEIHPKYMQSTIAAQNWTFTYDPSKSNMSFKDKIMFWLNRLTGKRWFEFENYTIVSKE